MRNVHSTGFQHGWFSENPTPRQVVGVEITIDTRNRPGCQAGNRRLINQETFLLRRQLSRLEQEFVEEGGFTERLYRVHNARRSEKAD